MNAHYSVLLPQAFVAGKNELKKLADLLADRIGNLEIIRADCADDVARPFKTVEELAKFENAKAKEIRRLHIFAHSDDFKERATIDLSGSRWRGVSLDFHAREDVVSRLRTDVLDIIEGMRPWYAVFHRVNFEFIVLLAFVLISFGAAIVVALKWLPADSSEGQNPSTSALAQLVIYGVAAILFATGIVLNRARDSLFPSAVFLIGQGEARFHHLERIHWGVIIAFIVSLAAGVVLLGW